MSNLSSDKAAALSNNAPKTSAVSEKEPSQLNCSNTVQQLDKQFGGKVVKAPKDQIVRTRCAGIDVHKKILVVAVCITDPATLISEYHVYRFKTTNSDLNRLASLFISCGVKDACMESTGKYWIPVYAVLEAHELNPYIVHPKYVKQLPGKKTDFTDAIHIASEFRLGKIKFSIILPEDFRNLRELTRMRRKYVNDRTAYKNRFHNELIEGMFRIGNTLSDIYGKTGTALSELAINVSADKITDEMIAQCIDPKCKRSKEEIIDSFRGFMFSETNKFMINELLTTIHELDKHIADFDAALKPYYDKYSKQIQLLMTMVGIRKLTAITILAEIGVDMSLWDDVASFVRWAGGAPGTHNSASTKHSTKCQGDKYLIAVLVEAARGAVRSTNQPYFMLKYKKLVKRRPSGIAVIAIVRKMLICIYYMLKTGKPFNPRDYQQVVENRASEKVAPTISNAVSILRKQGLSAEMIEKIKVELAQDVQDAGNKKGQSPKNSSSTSCKTPETVSNAIATA